MIYSYKIIFGARKIYSGKSNTFSQCRYHKVWYLCVDRTFKDTSEIYVCIYNLQKAVDMWKNVFLTLYCQISEWMTFLCSSPHTHTNEKGNGVRKTKAIKNSKTKSYFHKAYTTK